MNKAIKLLKIDILNKKIEKLTKAMWKEPKANMYKKHTEAIISLKRQIEELRKKYD